MTVTIIILTLIAIIYFSSTRNRKTELKAPAEKSVHKIYTESNHNNDIKLFLNNKIGYFSQAKTKEDAIFISKLVAPNGILSKWTDFRNTVLNKIQDYDKEILRAEYDTFYAMAQNYQQWKYIQTTKRYLAIFKI